MEAAIITTYRCNGRCEMCHIWKYPTKIEDEFKPAILNKLPRLSFCNLTGGEPFLRDDIDEIVYWVRKRAKRVVISTNGYFSKRILEVAKKYKDIGLRISLEGLATTNEESRGIKDGFDWGLKTLLGLKHLGIKDIGLAITVSDRNIEVLLDLYRLTKSLKVEFATAIVHNSYYFHKNDNKITKTEEVIAGFNKLIEELLLTKRIKNWYRAYFNYGIINYVKGGRKLLPCGAGRDSFFLDPWGELRPCNGLDSDSLDNSLGNLKEKTFEDIWTGEKAERIRKNIENCSRNCWMIGTASPAIKRHIKIPTLWVLKNKLRIMLGKKVN